MLRHQRHRRNTGKLAHQVAQALDLLWPATVHRYEHGIHRTFPDDSDRLRNGVAVQERKTAASGRIYANPLDRQQDRGYGRGDAIL
jgi:hypothetical protein